MIPRQSILYPINPNALYGPRFGNTRPFVLPEDVRHTSKPGAAAPHVAREASRLWAGSGADHSAFAEHFAVTVANIAETASQMMFALPGDRIGPHFTEWGAYQFNKPKWQQATQRHARRQDTPWQASAIEEIVVPLLCYRKAAQTVLSLGGAPESASRGIWLWHLDEPMFDAWVRAARETSFEATWSAVGETDPRRMHRDLTAFIDGCLQRCGVLRADDGDPDDDAG